MSSKGFTLIETLIVLAIVAVISSYALTLGGVGRRQTILNLEAQKVAEIVLRAKSLAVATFNMSFSSCGYGVEIDYRNQLYSLFSYATSTSQPSCSNIVVILKNNITYIPNESRKVETGVKLVGTQPDSLNFVLFVPPDPRTLLSADPGGAVRAASAKVYLETIDDSSDKARKEISVSVAGQVGF